MNFRDRRLAGPFLLAVLVGALLTTAIYAVAVAQEAVGALAIGFLAVALAALQIFIMASQTTLMTRQTALMVRQDKILERRADLNVYGHVTTDTNPLIIKELLNFNSAGGASSIANQLYITNSGSRAAVGFRLSARMNAGPMLREQSKNEGWTSYGAGLQVVFVFESERRIFPNDIPVANFVDNAGRRAVSDSEC